MWWTENLRSKLHHVVETINRTLSPQIYIMISFWDQLTEHTSHVLFIASLKSDSSHSPWTDAFSHQRITDTVNTWCIFIKTSILRNESGVGNVWRNSGKLHNRYLFSMKKSFQLKKGWENVCNLKISLFKTKHVIFPKLFMFNNMPRELHPNTECAKLLLISEPQVNFKGCK